MQTDPQPFRVFLNYRREDTAGHAGRLYDALTAHFPAEQVFIDVDTIEPGADFVEVVEEAVGSCTVLLALIGQRWLQVTNQAGPQRLHDEHDFVRMEIEAALNRSIRVIPVLVQGARMPSYEDLPETMRPLTRRNAIELSDHRWRYDTDQLVRVLERIRGAVPVNVPKATGRRVASPHKSSISATPTSVPEPATVRRRLAGAIIKTGRRNRAPETSASVIRDTAAPAESPSTALVRKPPGEPADHKTAEAIESGENNALAQRGAAPDTKLEAEPTSVSSPPEVNSLGQPLDSPQRTRISRPRFLVALLLAVSLGVGGYLLLTQRATTAPTSTSTTTSVPPIVTFHSYGNSGIDGAAAITVGPNGELWFTNSLGSSIGQVTSTGGFAFTSGRPGQIDNPQGIVEGPDGAIWFTNYTGNTIGWITPTKGSIEVKTISSRPSDVIDHPWGIAVGLGKELWFTNEGNGTIGEINVATHMVVSTHHEALDSQPMGITAGPDGTLWFTNYGTSTIGEITASGHIQTWPGTGNIDKPCAITSGPDDSLWFTNCGGKGSIGEITMNGTVTIFPHKGISDPTSIIFADGALWFTNERNNSIGRMTTNGLSISSYRSSATNILAPSGIARGRAGDLWFTNYNVGTIGRLSVQAAPS